jgi:putative transposase
MKKSRYAETQIVNILKEVEAGRLVVEVCCEYSYPTSRTVTGKPALRPELVDYARKEHGASLRVACRAVGVSDSVYR